MIGTVKMDDKKMRVGLVAPIPPPYGGIANWTRIMCENVPQNVKYELINISPGKRGIEGRDLFDRIVVSGLDIFRKKWALSKLITHNRIDVMHMTTSGQFAVIRDLMLLRQAKKKRVPSIYHIRFGRISAIMKKNSLEWKLIYRAMQLATAVVVIDKKTFNCLKEYKDIEVSYIPNPITLEGFSCIKPEGVSRQILFLGWCIKTKGMEELLAAWEKLSLDYNDWQLKIIGPYNRNYIDSLKERYSFRNVTLCGEREHSEALKMMNLADIFILPSYSEGFPNVILEAMGLGKAIVATNVGAIPEMLADKAGILIEPYNVDSIILALDQLISNRDLREEIGKNAYKKVRECYSYDIIMKKYEELWNVSLKDE